MASTRPHRPMKNILGKKPWKDKIFCKDLAVQKVIKNAEFNKNRQIKGPKWLEFFFCQKRRPNPVVISIESGGERESVQFHRGQTPWNWRNLRS